MGSFNTRCLIMVKAIVLLSGGLDSAVVLALAKSKGCFCHTITFDYQQNHREELEAAVKIAAFYGVSNQIIKIDSTGFNSSLTTSLSVPQAEDSATIIQKGISNTYVPGRNTLFLSYALSYCEVFQAQEIHFGPNLLDKFCYPDCHPNYLAAFQQVMNYATQQAVEGNPPRLVTPLLELDKVGIIRLGMDLKVPVDLTWSCYSPKDQRIPCNKCLACLLRNEAFEEINTSL